MATLHGSWIRQPQASYFLIWGEVWRAQPSIERDATAVPVHPLAMTREELHSFARSHQVALGDAETETDWQPHVLALPSQGSSSRKGDFVAPLLSSDPAANADVKLSSLQWWQIGGECFDPLLTARFLQTLPLGTLQAGGTYLGDDLGFWAQVYRWSLDLAARCKFLPGIEKLDETQWQSFWYPLLDSALDQSRLAKFAQLMPPICRAYGTMVAAKESPSAYLQALEPQALLLNFLSHVVDAQLRTWLDLSVKPMKGSLVAPWLQTLQEKRDRLWETEVESQQRLTAAMQTWLSPVGDFLVTPKAQKIGGDRFQACFVLQPPTEGEVRWGQLDWKLNYYLRLISDPTILVDAGTIWQHPVDEFIWQDCAIANPQETLLQGLGLAARLYLPIEASLNQKQPIQCILNPVEVYEFIRASAWQLQNSGFGVVLPSGLASGTENRLGVKIQAKVLRKKGERLGLKSPLNYQLELAVGEQTISKEDFEQLLAQQSPLVQVNGEWLALQPADARAAQAILEPSEDPINLSVEDALRFSTGDIKTFAKLPVMSFEATGILKELIANLIENKPIEPLETPKEFRGELRPYQSRGMAWLAFLERWSLGACLADDMGLGKTAQLIAFLLHLKQEGALNKATLVVCPTSVLSNWEREIQKFAPTLSVFVHHGDKRSKGKAFAKEIKNKDLAITSYSLVYRDLETLEQVDWEGVVLDEAQNVKNPQAKQAQAVRKLNAGFRIALTGTPIENRLSELWSILDFLNPGFLGNRQFFQRRFAIPIEKYGDRDSLQILRSLVQPFILRRLKTDTAIIQDLPEKQEMNVFCNLSAEQAHLYQQAVDESLQKIEEAEGIQRHGLILTLLIKLKQICNHPAQYLKDNRLGKGDRSGKLLRLQEMLEEVVAEGDRALIFTQFAEWGKLLQPYLSHQLDTEVLFLYGATRRHQRQEMIDRFQNDPEGPQIMILSLKAGGTGLNLTRANHVFHVDRWWNPAVENQATDRAFRIGQKRNVQVHKFISTGTLEEKINDIIESKKQLADQTVDAGEQWLTELDTDQLRNLLVLDRSAVMDE
jgi:SNF2 family DNA or RNA helicase